MYNNAIRIELGSRLSLNSGLVYTGEIPSSYISYHAVERPNNLANYRSASPSGPHEPLTTAAISPSPADIEAIFSLGLGRVWKGLAAAAYSVSSVGDFNHT